MKRTATVAVLVALFLLLLISVDFVDSKKIKKSKVHLHKKTIRDSGSSSSSSSSAAANAPGFGLCRQKILVDFCGNMRGKLLTNCFNYHNTEMNQCLLEFAQSAKDCALKVCADVNMDTTACFNSHSSDMYACITAALSPSKSLLIPDDGGSSGSSSSSSKNKKSSVAAPTTAAAAAVQVVQVGDASGDAIMAGSDNHNAADDYPHSTKPPKGIKGTSVAGVTLPSFNNWDPSVSFTYPPTAPGINNQLPSFSEKVMSCLNEITIACGKDASGPEMRQCINVQSSAVLTCFTNIGASVVVANECVSAISTTVDTLCSNTTDFHRCLTSNSNSWTRCMTQSAESVPSPYFPAVATACFNKVMNVCSTHEDILGCIQQNQKNLTDVCDPSNRKPSPSGSQSVSMCLEEIQTKTQALCPSSSAASPSSCFTDNKDTILSCVHGLGGKVTGQMFVVLAAGCVEDMRKACANSNNDDLRTCVSSSFSALHSCQGLIHDSHDPYTASSCLTKIESQFNTICNGATGEQLTQCMSQNVGQIFSCVPVVLTTVPEMLSPTTMTACLEDSNSLCPDLNGTDLVNCLSKNQLALPNCFPTISAVSAASYPTVNVDDCIADIKTKVMANCGTYAANSNEMLGCLQSNTITIGDCLTALEQQVPSHQSTAATAACITDARRYCDGMNSTDLRQCLDDNKSVMLCPVDPMPTTTISSSSSSSGSSSTATSSVAIACLNDANYFCSGASNIADCMQQNLDKISDECNKAISNSLDLIAYSRLATTQAIGVNDKCGAQAAVLCTAYMPGDLANCLMTKWNSFSATCQQFVMSVYPCTHDVIAYCKVDGAYADQVQCLSKLPSSKLSPSCAAVMVAPSSTTTAAAGPDATSDSSSTDASSSSSSLPTGLIVTELRTMRSFTAAVPFSPTSNQADTYMSSSSSMDTDSSSSSSSSGAVFAAAFGSLFAGIVIGAIVAVVFRRRIGSVLNNVSFMNNNNHHNTVIHDSSDDYAYQYSNSASAPPAPSSSSASSSAAYLRRDDDPKPSAPSVTSSASVSSLGSSSSLYHQPRKTHTFSSFEDEDDV